jgi:uncharacterized membrane protein YraQ (UPF0718 family)
MAFLIATPELGPETLTLTVRLLGWPFAIARLASALLLAFLAALFFARMTTWTPSAAERIRVAERDEDTEGSWLSRAYRHFDEFLLHTAPWTFVGLMSAAYLQAVVPTDSLAPLSRWGLDLFVVALVAMPTYVCAASATPIAAILLLKGISPGAVLVGLLLGPATNIATVGVLRRGYGTRSVVLGVLAIVAISLGLAALVNLLALPVEVPATLSQGHEHGIVDWVALGVLLLALAVQLGRGGPRPWFGVLDAGAVGEDGHHHHHHHHHGSADHEHAPHADSPEAEEPL